MLHNYCIRDLIKNGKKKLMKQILIHCVMQRENLQDAMALAESPRDEFVAKGLEKLKKIPNRGSSLIF